MKTGVRNKSLIPIRQYYTKYFVWKLHWSINRRLDAIVFDFPAIFYVFNNFFPVERKHLKKCYFTT
jgi:hypothetical protein